MDDSLAISIKNVSKKYRLFDSIQERMKEALHPFRKKYHREFWALKNISFDVEKGTTLGIIGQNGSGKSTLLQIICSVLQATEGEVSVNGRVAALLELGAGFNPEFTGRENVRFNGSVMGFSADEMSERLPLIEKFADIGEFMDQPVKVYSSGMFARLAFATAINVDPEILVIDEAFSVGDAKFQQKCFGKFRDFQNSGKTILFVSHDSNAILKNCNYAILLEKGGNICEGSPNEVVRNYQNLILTGSTQIKGTVGEDQKIIEDINYSSLSNEKEIKIDNFISDFTCGDVLGSRQGYSKNEYRFGDGRSKIIDCLFISGNQVDPVSIFSGENLEIYLKVRFFEDIEEPAFGFGIKSVEGIMLYANNTRFAQMCLEPVQKDDVVIIKFSFRINLHAGEYFFDFGSGEKVGATGVPLDFRNGVFHLTVLERKKFDGCVDLDSCIDMVRRIKAFGEK